MEMDGRYKDSDLEELLEKYGGTNLHSKGSRAFTPDSGKEHRLRRFASRDSDVKTTPQKDSEFRQKSVLLEDPQSVRRPSPIRYEDFLRAEEPGKTRFTQSPMAMVRQNKSPRPGTESLQDFSGSKAFTLAMKALQERVRFLESENAKLKEEKNRGSLTTSESQKASFQTMETDLQNLISKAKFQQDQISVLTSDLQAKSASLQRSQKDLMIAREELQKAKDLIERLQLHQNEYKKLAKDQEQGRVLEVRNQNLEELANNQRSQIEFLKSEIEELQRIHKGSEDARLALLSHQGKAKSLVEDVAEVNEQLVDSLKKKKERRSGSHGRAMNLESSEDAKHVSTEEQFLESTRTAHFGKSEISGGIPANHNITRLEHEIEDYNRQYKDLLRRSQAPGADLLGLRVELNSIATAMEAKSNHLAAIRRQQSQDFGTRPSGYIYS